MEKCSDHGLRLQDGYCPACEHDVPVTEGIEFHWGDAHTKFNDKITPAMFDRILPKLEDPTLSTRKWPEKTPAGHGNPGEIVNVIETDEINIVSQTAAVNYLKNHD